MEEKNYRYFAHTACEYFPCHPDGDRENFNCLFCYCPLYALGKDCGGNFTYTDGGHKDCSACLVPHRRENYQHIIDRYGDIVRLMKEREG